MNLFPKTVSAKDIQRSYRKIFDEAKATREPIIVLTNNSPDVAIVNVATLEELYSKARKVELYQAMEAIGIYKREKQAKKLIKLRSLKDLIVKK